MNKARPRFLSDINPNAVVLVDRWDWILPEPIASPAMEIVAAWSEVDVVVMELVAAMLGADAVSVCDMLSDLRSARMSAIRSLAKHRLKPDERKSFNRCMDVVDSARRATRDRYAHHVWTTAEGIPADTALLMDPRHVVRSRVALVELMRLLRATDSDSTENVEAFFRQMRDLPRPTLDPGNARIIYPDEVSEDARTSEMALAVIYNLSVVLGRTGGLEWTELLNRIASLHSRVQACYRRWP